MGNINFLVVFLEGIISLFSPCVLPIIPVYIAILTGSTGDEEGTGKSPILNTVLFILGISTTFFILGSSIRFFSKGLIGNKEVMNIVGGIFIVIMGLFFMGWLKIPALESSKKFSMKDRKMGPLTAYLLGLTFSLGWSPCVGPMLGSAMIMASNSASRLQGNLLILAYTLGFILPFVIMAIFYDRLEKHIDKLHDHSDKIKKIGGLLLILSGILMATGGLDKFGLSLNEEQTIIEEEAKEEVEEESGDSGEESLAAPDFKLVDQYGKDHILSDYQGKVVFLNFWATWCPPCRMEMPDIQSIYEERGYNEEDVVILGVAGPNLGSGRAKEGSIEEIKEFLKENSYDYPILFDETGELFMTYGIQSFPSTFIIDRDGNIDGYIPSAVPKDVMENAIDTTRNR